MTATPDQPAAPAEAPRLVLNRPQKGLIGAVFAGAITIAGIGFAGSYQAVAKLAEQKHFGDFATWFPIGIDAGIGVLLALDLLLTWLRIPYPLLRQAAWTLTGATIAFNAAAAWGDDLAVAMHAAIPALFAIVVEAARHAVGRLAKLHADTHYENPPVSRWFLAPWPTYRIWRRMRLWGIRSYIEVVEMERQAEVLRATLKTRHGRRKWKKEADDREILALRLARLGTPVRDTLASRYETGVASRPASHRKAASPGTARPTLEPASAATPATASASAPAATPIASASPEPLPEPIEAASANETGPAASESAAPANAPGAPASKPRATATKASASGEQRDLDEVADTFRGLRERLGRNPSDQALADELGVGRSRAQQLRTAAIKAGHTDLEKPLRAAS
ncbi:DUF2637 domain-containing protein [Kitasatospora sp. NPDC001683]